MIKKLASVVSALTIVISLLSGTHAAFAQPTVTEFPVASDQYGSYGITTGPDGALWFAHLYPNLIGRITTNGALTEYPIPTTDSAPYDITTGPDGALWFTELGGNKIGRITTNGVVTEFPVPTAASLPYDITAGPDGALWFSEGNGNNIGRITTNGTITEYPVPTSNSYPFGIAAGPDGNIWFTESFGNNVGRITPSGTITEFPTGGNYLYGITAGPGGNMWFVNTFGNSIDQITMAGVVTSFPVPAPANELYNITSGPDGNLWFTDQTGHVSSITTDGTVTEYASPTPDSLSWGITTGPDGNLWFTEVLADNIGRLSLQAADTIAPSIGMPAWTNNPKPISASTTLTAPVTDSSSGVARAEYFMGNTDPGLGNGTAMTLTNQQTNGSAVTSADATATFGTSLQPGVYKVSIRAQDVAGNWSPVMTDYLVVYDPSGPTDVAASKKIIPQLVGGDNLPGLLDDSQNDKADLGFDALLTPGGTVDPASKLSLDYSTGKSCNSPHPSNCHTTTFSVTTVPPNAINWLSIGGTNNSVGTFQGQGTLTIDGITTTNPFKVTATDGNRTTPTSSDDVVLQIFAPGADPDTAPALYQLHIHVSGNWTKIQ